ncbi:DUF937 domain-containing protein [Rhizobium sp. PAMB 3174]
MLPLFDMMMQAQNGAAVEAMAKQYNIAQEQAAKAMAALMPAFSSGLQRKAANPYDFTTFLAAMQSGNYAEYFEDIGKAFTPKGIADGNAALETIFGSKEVSRAIAAQVEQMTGIGQEIVKQMMPATASTLMGGIFKQSMGQVQQANAAFTNAAMTQMMQQWLESTGFAPKPQPQANPFDNPFTQAMQSMFGGQQQAKQVNPADMFAANPFMKMFSDMMKPAEDKKPEPEPKPEPPKESAAGAELKQYSDMMSAMFDSGLEVGKAYQKSIESILDGYMKNGDTADKS